MADLLELTLHTFSGRKALTLEVEHVWNGGWAGRDQEMVRRHAAELREHGVEPPTSIPILFPVARNLVMSTSRIQVISAETSGEVEYVLLFDCEDIYVTVASDHTDRGFERHSMQASKQLYPKVIAAEVWRYEECADHWDELVLRCWATTRGKRLLYQEARLAELLSAKEWIDRLVVAGVGRDGVAFLSGTPPTLGSLIYADGYELEIEDQVLGRSIRHVYTVEVLPAAGLP